MRVEEGEGEAGGDRRPQAAIARPPPRSAPAAATRGETPAPHRRTETPRRRWSPQRSGAATSQSACRARRRRRRSAAHPTARRSGKARRHAGRSSPWRRMNAFCAPIAMISEAPRKKPAMAAARMAEGMRPHASANFSATGQARRWPWRSSAGEALRWTALRASPPTWRLQSFDRRRRAPPPRAPAAPARHWRPC